MILSISLAVNSNEMIGETCMIEWRIDSMTMEVQKEHQAESETRMSLMAQL
jgi:hypothetical protein